jgi:hypothetical protein
VPGGAGQSVGDAAAGAPAPGDLRLLSAHQPHPRASTRRRSGVFPFGYRHRVLTGQFGLALGELWWLEDLALSCRRDGPYEMFLTAAPINVPGGTGSPANACHQVTPAQTGKPAYRRIARNPHYRDYLT